TAVPSVRAPKSVEVALECIRPDVTIRYTLDGKEPDASSRIYSAPLEISCEDTVKAATFFDDGRKAGKTLTLPIIRNEATACRITGNADAAPILTNGVRGSLRQSDFEWTAWTGKNVDFTIELGDSKQISQVEVGTLTNYCMGVHKPKSFEVEVSADGENFVTVAKRVFPDDEIFVDGNFVEDIVLGFEPVKASYIRISVGSAGKCPSNHVRPGMDSKVCLDEVMVR
ncbi:protein containing Coagulation factor 5/8 type, partial [gut metagenome]